MHSLVILNHFINEKFQAEEVEGNTNVWCGVMWCGEVWCSVVWCCEVWCSVVSCRVVR